VSLRTTAFALGLVALAGLAAPDRAAAQSSKPLPASNASSSAPFSAPAPVVQRQMASPVQKTIQREITLDSPKSEDIEEPEREEQAEVDVDRLARDVYKMLQNRLRIERERRDRL